MGPGHDISHESYRLTLFPLSTSPPTYSISDMGFDSLLRTVSSLHLVSASSVLIIVIFSNDAAITTSFHICSSIVSGSDYATSTSKCPPPTPNPIPAYHHYTSCLTVYHSSYLSACFSSDCGSEASVSPGCSALRLQCWTEASGVSSIP